MVVHSTPKNLTRVSYILDSTFFLQLITFCVAHVTTASLDLTDSVFFACCVATKTIAFDYVSTSSTFLLPQWLTIVSVCWGTSVASLPMGVGFEDTTSLS